MNNNWLQWLMLNWVEIAGAVLGIAYVFLSVKQNILTWAMGLATSLLYIYVFFVAKFYADMALQFYYVWVSIYGWFLWSRGKTSGSKHEKLPVSRMSHQMALLLGAVSVFLWSIIYVVLKYYTDSPVPFGDAFTTALSIVATWMLAKKIIEHWLVWIVVDVVSIGLYIYKGLLPTTILFVVYTLVAIWGFVEWRKDLRLNDEND
ncbi:MAG: nicotinamide mononucleotide transporter [Prolixibacteraceae bacterium]|nr:nicotinamide mononucleotide transporter [Prolixibacteraceae bacterium]MBN2648553.1 nicotinamide mononucleotide transporter [Prolixibacteraceae bacterium]